MRLPELSSLVDIGSSIEPVNDTNMDALLLFCKERYNSMALHVTGIDNLINF
jgi:hypothetical protein